MDNEDDDSLDAELVNVHLMSSFHESTNATSLQDELNGTDMTNTQQDMSYVLEALSTPPRVTTSTPGAYSSPAPTSLFQSSMGMQQQQQQQQHLSHPQQPPPSPSQHSHQQQPSGMSVSMPAMMQNPLMNARQMKTMRGRGGAWGSGVGRGGKRYQQRGFPASGEASPSAYQQQQQYNGNGEGGNNNSESPDTQKEAAGNGRGTAGRQMAVNSSPAMVSTGRGKRTAQGQPSAHMAKKLALSTQREAKRRECLNAKSTALLYFHTKQASSLQRTIEKLRMVAEECSLTCWPDGTLAFMGMEKSCLAMYEAFVRVSALGDWRCPNKFDMMVTSLNSLSRNLPNENANCDTEVFWIMTQSNPNELFVYVFTDGKAMVSCCIPVAILPQPASCTLGIDKADNVVALSADALRDVCSHKQSIAELLNVKFTSKAIEFETTDSSDSRRSVTFDYVDAAQLLSPAKRSKYLLTQTTGSAVQVPDDCVDDIMGNCGSILGTHAINLKYTCDASDTYVQKFFHIILKGDKNLNLIHFYQRENYLLVMAFSPSPECHMRFGIASTTAETAATGGFQG